MTPDCDSVQESAKIFIITTKGFKIPKGKRTKARDVTLKKPVSEYDGILQPVIEEVAAIIEGSGKSKNTNKKARG